MKSRLTYIKDAAPKIYTYENRPRQIVRYVVCKCSCGNVCTVKKHLYAKNKTLSCGCYHKEQFKAKTTHGMSNTRFERIYRNMRNRCRYKKYHEWKYYGGKGVQLLWESLADFKEDMYKSYLEHAALYGEKDTTIDRIDGNGNYCKKNCRWATYKVQSNNRTAT